MPKHIVVGAGIVGASVGYHLAKAGVEVVMIDRKDHGQATDAAAGIVCPWLSQRRNQAWYQLAKKGAAFYPKLIEELESQGETETGYKQVGAIALRQEEKKLIAMEERAYKRRKDAPEIGEITRLTPKETKALFPPLSDAYSAIHISGGARVDGRQVRDALRRAAVKHGASFIEGSATIHYTGKEVHGVSVNDQEMKADKIIVTAGVWAKEFLKPLGIDLAVEPQKAQISHFHIPNTDTSKWPVVMPPSNHYLLAFDNGRIVAGATHEDDVSLEDTRVTTSGMKEIFDKALSIAPELGESSLLETRVGFRPVTPGFLPIIGAVPNYDNILIANGLGSSGLTTGPFIGAQLAKLATGEDIDIDLNLYPVSGALQ
ncbi:FAD-binding oxidoreductase [Aquibacillus koreensis]|uniref:FAD-binding oxidoreductase n=1 Tax=Aquibacillus koreensis TaxID=279446 RepID=A0A9X3WLW1_9BACI|nr:FAD-binding oxidoreductase [Aquibacillus koreensis]MCT2536150.1 FAD-binding oxidoreductase [Aquibacillus koreensis]MDC3422075.1 FAD-binding oxidoreductase [Aquibacillus koreensis]